MKYENLFSYPNGTSLDELLHRGIFFRGESKKYKKQIPGLYRDINYIQHENEIVINGMLTAADQLENRSLFDTLTLLQHYGSNTRILDITSNALVALYFAVSTNLNNDGYVYLLSGNQLGNEDNEKVKSPIDKSVVTKTCLSRLNFDEKRILSNLFSNIFDKDRNQDIKEYFINNGNKQNCLKKERTISKLYSLVEKELSVSNFEIPICDLFGYDLVRPFSLDERVISQSGLFIVFGLENINKIDKEYHSAVNNDSNLKDLEREKIGVQANPHRKFNEVPKLESEINNVKKSIYKKILEDEIQSTSTHYVYKLSMNYSPIISELKGEDRARIKIKSKYKQRILDELNMLGIKRL